MARAAGMRRALTLSVALIGGLAAEAMLDGGFVIPQAQAVIGRPLTPLSYAGVARRTVTAGAGVNLGGPVNRVGIR